MELCHYLLSILLLEEGVNLLLGLAPMMTKFLRSPPTRLPLFLLKGSMMTGLRITLILLVRRVYPRPHWPSKLLFFFYSSFCACLGGFCFPSRCSYDASSLAPLIMAPPSTIVTPLLSIGVTIMSAQKMWPPSFVAPPVPPLSPVVLTPASPSSSSSRPMSPLITSTLLVIVI